MNNSKTLSIESNLPIFSGFYNTIFSPENFEEYHQQEESTELEFNYDRFFRDAGEIITKGLNDLIAGIIPIKYKYVGLNSPKYYNFRNDYIDANFELTKEVYNFVIDYLHTNKEKFKEYLQSNYTSYDGFLSYYSNSIETWFNEYLLPNSKEFEHTISSAIEFIIVAELGKEVEFNLFREVYEELTDLLDIEKQQTEEEYLQELNEKIALLEEKLLN